MRCRVYNPPSPSPLSAGMSDGKIRIIKKNQSQLQKNTRIYHLYARLVAPLKSIILRCMRYNISYRQEYTKNSGA